MEIVVLSVLYWIAVGIMLLVGLIRLIFGKRTEKDKTPGLNLVIASVIMFVIGGGACAFLLSGLGSMR
jgi:multidrug transporter EmrE-like cation transporter